MSRPRVCIAGPLLGSVPGWVTSQGEILADCMAADGLEVLTTSNVVNRYLRPADIASSLVRWRNRIDVVVVMVYSGAAFATADLVSFVTKRLGKGVILALHGGNMPEFSETHRHWIARVLNRADAVVAPSVYLAEWAQARTNSPVYTIPNIVRLECYPFEHRHEVRPLLLWMRTFHDVYRPELAVDALTRLIPSFPEARLTMAGQDRGLLNSMRDLVKKQGLEDHVRFAGFLDGEDKRRKFAAHDIFLNTTSIDNLPVSLLEAAASGLPIVTTSVGGIPYTFTDESHALLVDGDAGDISQAVRRLLNEQGLARRLSKQAREMVKGMQSGVIDAWRACLDHVVSKRTAHR